MEHIGNRPADQRARGFRGVLRSPDRQLENYCRQEALDACEDAAAGCLPDVRVRLLEAALAYRDLVDRRMAMRDVEAALTAAFAKAGLL